MPEGETEGMAYDLARNVICQTNFNGAVITNQYYVANQCQYDPMNRLTNLVWRRGGMSLASFAYTLGVTGNRTALAETVNGVSRTNNWTYNYLYRLTGEQNGALATLAYGYDAVGNRTNRVSSATALVTNQTFTYTANDGLATDGYDPDGNTVTASGNTYGYDALDHLTNVHNGAVLMTYYGDRLRVSKTCGNTTTYYLVDDRNPSGHSQILEEWTATSAGTSPGRPFGSRGGAAVANVSSTIIPTTLSQVYNYGLNLISQSHPGVATYYVLADGHGSTRLLTDPRGTVQNTFTYDAYGNLLASDTTPQTWYLYCGQPFDPDLGVYLNRARYLNPHAGRFWTRDAYQGYNPAPLSLHKYEYCQQDPVDIIDPSGQASTVATQIGQDVHKYIGDDFKEKVVGGFSGPSVVTILEEIPGFKLPPKF